MSEQFATEHPISTGCADDLLGLDIEREKERGVRRERPQVLFSAASPVAVHVRGLRIQ
jgi:hypothetical protein